MRLYRRTEEGKKKSDDAIKQMWKRRLKEELLEELLEELNNSL